MGEIDGGYLVVGFPVTHRQITGLVGGRSPIGQFPVLSENVSLTLNPSRDGDVRRGPLKGLFTMKILVMNAAFALFVGVSGIAAAQADDLGTARQQIEVPYSDLNLSRPEGARIMLGRLQFAASKVCGGQPDMHSLERTMWYRRCMRQAMDGAVTRLGSPQVDALYGMPAQRLALGR